MSMRMDSKKKRSGRGQKGAKKGTKKGAKSLATGELVDITPAEDGIGEYSEKVGKIHEEIRRLGEKISEHRQKMVTLAEEFAKQHGADPGFYLYQTPSTEIIWNDKRNQGKTTPSKVINRTFVRHRTTNKSWPLDRNGELKMDMIEKWAEQVGFDPSIAKTKKNESPADMGTRPDGYGSTSEGTSSDDDGY